MIRLFYVYIFICIKIVTAMNDGNTLVSEPEEALVLLDSIAVLRVGSSGLLPIYYSDTWFVNPFGLIKSLEEIVIQNIWIAYGNEHGIKMHSDGASNEYSEQYFDMLQEQKGISRKKIEDMARDIGYSIEDVKKELNNQYLVQQTVETFFAASGKLNIGNDEIMQFYNDFPQYDEESFIIESGLLAIDFSCKIDMNDKNMIEKIVWSNKPCRILRNDLNDSFADIDSYKVGDIVYYEYDNNIRKFSCYRLLEKKQKRKLDFNELYEDIAKQLQAMKYEDGYKRMTESFLLSGQIIYDDIKIQNSCINYLKIQK